MKKESQEEENPPETSEGNKNKAHLKDKKPFGVDVYTGEPLPAAVSGIWDNYIVKRQFLNIAPVLAQQLLLVDEVMRAGKNMRGNRGDGQE
jgi:T-complex protein 1 subunit zeta